MLALRRGRCIRQAAACSKPAFSNWRPRCLQRSCVLKVIERLDCLQRGFWNPCDSVLHSEGCVYCSVTVWSCSFRNRSHELSTAHLVKPSIVARRGRREHYLSTNWSCYRCPSSKLLLSLCRDCKVFGSSTNKVARWRYSVAQEGVKILPENYRGSL